MIFIAGVILIFLLIFILCKNLNSNFNYWKVRNVPFENAYPIFGNYLNILLGRDSMSKYIEKMYKSFDGPYFGFVMLNKPYLVLKDPVYIKRILTKDFSTFPNRFFASNPKADFAMGNSIFTIKGSQWKTLRSQLSSLFTPVKMKMMLPNANKSGDNLYIYLNNNLDKSMDSKEVAAKFTTDIITFYAFGISVNSFASEDSEFRSAGRQISGNTFERAFSIISYSFAPLLVDIFRLKFFHADAAEFLRGAFMETIKQREASGVIRKDLIKLLLDIKNKEVSVGVADFNSDKLVSQAISFFFAGYETTASLIAFTLHELCVNKEIQDRLRKELLEVTEEYGGVTYEAVQSMKYLHMIILETLRKHAFSPYLLRESVQDYEIPETGLRIENGTAIIIPLHGLHGDPKYFPNPTKYDPERFSEENSHNLTLDVYLPLGAGPRSCMGELYGHFVSKLAIIYIISNFEVERNSDTQEPLVYYPTHHLRTENGLPLTFKKL